MRKGGRHRECLQDKYTHISPRVRIDPLLLLGLDVTKDQGVLILKLIRESAYLLGVKAT